MTLHEVPHESPVEVRLRTFVAQLADSGTDKTVESAKIVLERMNAKSLVVLMTDIPRHEGLTQFSPTPVIGGDTFQMSSCILLNQNWFLGSPPTIATADLVRTVHVAAQWPDKYEHRLSKIYDRALEAQTIWIEEHKTAANANNIVLNPRENDREEIKSRLLGPYYYSDTGLPDWNSAVAWRRHHPFSDGTPVKPASIAILATPEAFFYARELYTPEVHEQNLSIYPDLIEMNPDQRAFNTSIGLVNRMLGIRGNEPQVFTSS